MPDDYRQYQYELIHLALQLIDKATQHSKENVLKEYKNNKDAENIEEILFNVAVYPNGEKLGFYNISKYSLNDFIEKELTNKEFDEYMGGFNTEIKELFNSILKDRFSQIIKVTYPAKSLIEEVNEKLYLIDESLPTNIENKEDLNKLFITYLDNILSYDFEYINYPDLSKYFVDALFDGIEFQEKTSVLHIHPENTFLISCLEYIKNINSECNVDLYVITYSYTLAFALNFLAIIHKAKFKFAIDEVDKQTPLNDYQKLFDDYKNFDFIIQPDPFNSYGRHIRRGRNKNFGNYLLNYDINISSRLIYVDEFSNEIRLYEEWLENDLLESLILIPYRDFPFRRSWYKLAVLVILNFNKSEEKRNKFLVVDDNKNKVISTKEYDIEDFKDLVKRKDIYKNSFNAFSNFTDSEYSKVFNINEFKHKRFFNFNDEMYDLKMKNQQKYFDIEIVENQQHNIKQLNYKTKPLKDLMKMRFDDEGNKIDPIGYLYCLTNDYIIDGKWVFFNYEIFNPTIYHTIPLCSKEVTLDYLYHYLNSEMGINEYEYFVRGNRQQTKDFLGDIRVPIPPKKIQDKIVNAMNKREDFLYEVNQLKNKIHKNFFDYNHNLNAVNEFYGVRQYSEQTQVMEMGDNWFYTYSGLIWPLAITYLIATSGGYEIIGKANNLIRLFEFSIAFNSYVLMSAIPKDIYEEVKTKIWKKAYKNPKERTFVNMLKLGFGAWARFHDTLKGIYSDDNYKLETEINKEFYMSLMDKNIRNLYRDLADERNDFFHGEVSHEGKAKSILNELDEPKRIIFNHLQESYENIKLYYIKDSHDRGEHIEYDIMFLNGAYSMPIYTKMNSAKKLDCGKLYLHDTIEDKFTELNDNLIKFQPADDLEIDWRLYIFVGFETENRERKMIYKCYQRTEEDLKLDIDLTEIM